MAIKTFKVKIDGTSETIEYEDDITFGAPIVDGWSFLGFIFFISILGYFLEFFSAFFMSA